MEVMFSRKRPEVNSEKVSGPMYGGPLHNPTFINRMLRYLPGLDEDVYGMVIALKAGKQLNGPEAGAIQRVDPAIVDQHPFYFIPSALALVLHCQAPSDTQMRGALRYRGYRMTRSHGKPGATSLGICTPPQP